jgi:hypothetical protein
MIAAPMPSLRPAAARPLDRALGPLIALLAVVIAACGTTTPSPSPSGSGPIPSASGMAAASGTPQPTATLAPTPMPTPTYTNPADPELVALIPTRLQGITINVPPREQFAYTPGDFGSAYGELGLGFTALQVAYVEEPRLSLYVARVKEPLPSTRSLEPYLATAGQYVGIAGLHREPWRYRRIAGRVVWERPEDNATVAGTHIYTWATDGYVFLMIGVDDDFNRTLFAALPGESARAANASPPANPSPSATATASP